MEVRLPFSCFFHTKPPKHCCAQVSIHTKTTRMQLCGGLLTLSKISSRHWDAAVTSGLLDLPSRLLEAALSVSKPPFLTRVPFRHTEYAARQTSQCDLPAAPAKRMTYRPFPTKHTFYIRGFRRLLSALQVSGWQRRLLRGKCPGRA